MGRVADDTGPEQVEDVSGADRARADAEWGGTPAALGTSGAAWHDLAGDQQTRRASATGSIGSTRSSLNVDGLARGA
ncbi:MAG: hypothetical protein M3360_02480, partial [Actinomycetota bacterium]|nr:hypothetical protein [Actinomycetota bacterium]